MIAAIVNAAVIILGSLVGLLLHGKLPERYNDAISKGLGLCTVVIGLSTALKTANMLIVIMSVAIGGFIGCLIDIEKWLGRLGTVIESRFSKGEEGSFAKGFVTASLLYCVGAMAIVGSLDAGLRGDYSTIFAKSVLDGVMAIFLTGSCGIGVMASAVTVLVYQGFITLLAGAVEPVLTAAVVTEMSAAGGVLIMGIGLNLIRKEHIPVGNLLPAVLLPIVLTGLFL